MRFFLLMAGTVALLASDALACSCATPEPKRRFHGADAVFVGEADDVDDSGMARMRVVEGFKGVRAGDVVDIKWDHGMCSYGLARAKVHLIWAHVYDDGNLSVSMCSGARPIADAGCEVELLRRRAWWWRIPLSRIPLETGRARANPCRPRTP